MASMLSQALTWVPGACTTTYTHSPEPLVLPAKSGPARAFSELCKDTIPPCNLNPLLCTGHLQTAYTSFKSPAPHIHYKRRVFAAEDPAFVGHFTVDFVVPEPAASGTEAEDGGKDDAGLREDPVGVGHLRLPPRTTYFTDDEFADLDSNDTKPLLITLHGLSGGSYESYLRHVLKPLVTATPEGGKFGISGGEWEALVVNSRGCAGSKITSSILYNARATWDVRHVVKWCRKTWPRRPLFGIGYSLGANILANYLGEEGSSCLLSAAVIVSSPWNLEVSSRALQRTIIGRELYSKTMGSHMRVLFNNHEEQITRNTAISRERIGRMQYLYEFDREVQCATWGYPTEGAYYRDASSVDSVIAIRVPVLVLHALDDPIAVEEALPYGEIKRNPYVVLCATSGGGHLSWFEWGGGRWHARAIPPFLNAMAHDVDFDKIKPPKLNEPGPHGGHEMPFVFEAMRRKCHVPGGDQ